MSNIQIFPPKDDKVYSTYDYSKFKRLKGNRDVTSHRKKKIEESILSQGLIGSPITVNEKMEVIDGQARLAILEKLQLPVFYIIAPETGIDECIAMNISSTSWTVMDYIDNYAENGNVNYIRARGLIAEYSSVVGITTVLNILSGHSQYGGSARKFVSSGRLRCDEQDVYKARKTLDWLKSISPIFTTCSNKVVLQKCLLACLEMEGLDRDRLAKKLLNAGTIKGYSKTEDCLDVLSEIYNKGTHNENRMDFRHIYKFNSAKKRS